MCIVTRNIFKRTALRRKVVYKILSADVRSHNSRSGKTYRALFNNFGYKLNTLYQVNKDEFLSICSRGCSGKGFYSYSKCKLHKVLKDRYSSTLSKSVLVAKCVLPKGAIYYYEPSRYGREYVSTKIIVEDVMSVDAALKELF